MQPSQKRLSIQAGLYGLSYFLENGPVHAYDRRNFRVSGPAGIEPHLRSVLDELMVDNDIEQVRIFHHNPWNVWVPLALFDERQADKYLQTHIRLFRSDAPAWDVFEDAGVVNVYLPMVNLNNILLDYVKEIDFYHSAGMLQQYAWKHFPEDLQWRVLVRTSGGDFQIGAWQGRRLKFFNTFRMENTDDFLYYFFFVWEKNQWDRHRPEIILTGPGAHRLYDELKSFTDRVQTLDLEQTLLKLP